ncbi:MAG: hypothetical protein A2Y10_17425 [Planctomycetes bacterium GWF2_41_51]|nr:MAG: hypothetical protein A2Y10_17425 [Planctomycetes bacterium GWF2_41_51]HBG28008.1 hypothetical protein [Phycisphaerales bacterium]
MSNKFNILFSILLTCGVSFAELYLYDNFNSAEVSNDRWNLGVIAPATVEFTEGQALLDMSIVQTDPSTLERCRIKATHLSPIISTADSGRELRFTWDMQHVDPHNNAPTTHDCDNGLWIGIDAGAGYFVAAGQEGKDSGTFDFKRCFTLTGMPKDIERGTDKYHYDLSMTVTEPYTGNPDLMWVSADFSVYTYNAAYDSHPEYYVSETPLLRYIRGLSLPVDIELDVIFYNDSPYIYKSSIEQYGAMTIDNLWQNIYNPCSELLQGDIDKDCYVNMQDMALLADDWMKCSNMADSDCNL